MSDGLICMFIGVFIGVVFGVCLAVSTKSTVIVHGKGDLLITEYDHKLYRLVKMDGEQ